MTADNDPTRLRSQAQPTKVHEPQGQPTKAREPRDSPSRSDSSAVPDFRAAATATRARGAATAAAPTGIALEEGYKVRGRYLLEKLIGEGGMGQVWQARDLLGEEAHDRNPRVALKLLKRDIEARPDAFVALHREAQRAQKLAHPNVATVYVFDRDDASGRVFIAMELLEGRPLDDVIRSAGIGGLPREQSLPIIRGMAEGLAYAHRRGIVHADFKPANIFITRDGTPKILDFGIARAVRGAESPDSESASNEVDDSGFRGVTIAYAAPEAIEEAEPNTAQDVFALGVVACELVTGRNPFDRASAVEARADPHFTRAPLHGLRRRESRAIEKAIEFDPRQRFADAGAFLKALQGVPAAQKALLAAVGVLVLAAGGLWYRSHLESLPNEPLEQLPAAVQHAFLDKVRQGNESLAYLRRTHDITASADAAQYFADAYRLHPKDPQAVSGLDTAAEYAIGWYARFPDRREALAELQRFRAKSDYYQRYRPLQQAIREAGGR